MRNFSWSRINTFANCPYRYKLRYIDHIVPVKKAPALALGYAMSCGLKAYRQTGDRDAAFTGFTDAWKEDGQVLLVKKEDDPRRSVERGLEILGNYMDKYPDEPDMFVRPEVKFDIEVAPGINFTGRIDGVVRLIDGSLAIDEDKTTSRMGKTYFPNLRGSSQILWYLWVAKEMGLFDVEGKKHSPKCLLNALYIHPETDFFDRDITIKSARVLDLARDNMLMWINRIIAAEEADCFPMNDVDNSRCIEYGGCDYLPLKYLRGSLRERIIKNEFKSSVRKEKGNEHR